MSRFIYKDKFSVINSSYECGFFGKNNDIVYTNELNAIVPRFIILEVLLVLIIVSCYLCNNKTIISALLIITLILSIYFSKDL
ncbi:MAG: hypothetical protein IJ848_00605 [Alphaproteobacteria bacterium]|nr:hypothetical protein [Alphaproteobacteria bacterium]